MSQHSRVATRFFGNAPVADSRRGVKVDDSINLEKVCLRRNGKEILRDVDWRMRRGENWAIIGANGSGKTTLLQIAGGVLFPTSGRAEVLGGRFGSCDLFAIRRRVGWVSSALQARMPTSDSALDIVASGLKATFGLVYEYTEADREKAEAALDRLGLGDRASALFGVLSQGEQQKTLFARATMANPDLLILDEACSGLDLQARESFLRVVDGMMAAGDGPGVIMVTHHIEEIPPGIGHALILKDGRALAAGPVAETVNSAILTEAFGIDVHVEQRNGRFWARVG